MVAKMRERICLPTRSPPPNRRIFPGSAILVSTGVALFLLTAAGLKLHSLLARPYGAGSPLLSRTAEFGLVQGEILLALWLLSGWQRRGAWFTAAGVFGLFALASLYLVWQGQSSCGCFGEVPVSPWLTFMLDLLVLGLLCWFRPPAMTSAPRWALLRPATYMLVSTALLLGVGTVALFILGITPAQALARLRGDLVTVEPATLDGGVAAKGTLKTVVLHLANNSEHPIRIVGGTTDCSCVTTEDLPLTIPAGKQRPLHIRFKFTGSAGVFKRTYWLYTDDPRQPVVVAWLTGSVSP